MSIVLMTTNIRKIEEFRFFLSRHGQALLVENPTESEEILQTWLQTARAVVADESNIFTLEGDLVESAYVGPAKNVCRLHAWVLREGMLTRMSYIREVIGHFDGLKLRPADGAVFGWDSAFTPIDGVSLHDMAEKGLKSSAREQCLSAFVKAFMRHKEHKKLRWRPVEASSIIDWNVDARVLLDHPLYQGLAPELRNVFHAIIDHGVFFRAAASRRDGNYWFPGLNGGIPYVPKGDPIHEAGYQFHDVMHQLMPDLVFDGTDTPDHRRTYIAYRMMSEAVSLVLADMRFIHGLASDPAHAGYDFSARRIYPLYQALEAHQQNDLRWLLKQMVRFVLLGDRGAFPVHSDAWAHFESKYARFFIADFQWTRMNWSNLVGRTDMARDWIELIHPETLRTQEVWLVSDVVDVVGRDLRPEGLVEKLFDHVWQERIMPALAFDQEIDLFRASSNGFRRWLTGQCAFFARYAPIIGISILGRTLAERVRDPRPFTVQEMTGIRAAFGDHIQSLAKKGILSDDDVAIFPDVFPLFDPFFLRDYDRSEQEFMTVAEASAVAFA